MKQFQLETKTDPNTGLTEEQAAKAPHNTTHDSGIKPVGEIVREHVFTYFNLVNMILAVLIALTGSWRNLMFMGVVVGNTVIGLFQELRSRRALMKLQILSQNKSMVLRSGKQMEIPTDQIALGDILILSQGDQVPVDGVLVSGSIQVNESLLTGESDDIDKTDGSSIYSGCYVTMGKGKMQAAAVGENTYMDSILKEARRSRPYPSQLRDSLNRIIHFSTRILFPAGILLFGKMMLVSHTPWKEAILSTSASLIGMIPEGLVILTSVALAVSVAKLARQYVLVHELYCIETLARVNVLCLDKTGTITSGDMHVDSLVPMGDLDAADCRQVLANMFAALEDQNATAKAIREYCRGEAVTEVPVNVFPFSSTTKFSGTAFQDETWIAGAYSFIFEHPDPKVEKQIDEYASQGIRVLVLARGPVMEKLEKGDYKLEALILIEDELRKDVNKILSYFESQDVDLKVISGDNPATVAAIAKRAGITGKAYDMTQVSTEELPQAVKEGSIFGRVTPEQKRDMVLALKSQGNTVAMTGDGVNDVLALREADCSIAMGTGTQAARAVASIVLLKDQFDVMPGILNEGRRVINNIQRTASLFLVKTLFSFGLSILTLFWLSEYPFHPIQLTLISFLGVGLPSFVLTLEPNYARVTGNFLLNVLSRAIPGASCVILLVIITRVFSPWLQIDQEQFSTIMTWLAGINALSVLVYTCKPMTKLRLALCILMVCAFFGAMFFMPGLYEVVSLPKNLALYTAIAGACIPFFLKWSFSLPWQKRLSRFRKGMDKPMGRLSQRL